MEHNIPICSLRDVMGRRAGPNASLSLCEMKLPGRLQFAVTPQLSRSSLIHFSKIVWSFRSIRVKNDSHIAVGSCVSDPSKSRKVFACVSDLDPNFCSSGKSLVRRRTAAIQAQVGDSLLKPNFRLQISYFNAGHERVATNARTFDAHGCRFVCAIGHNG